MGGDGVLERTAEENIQHSSQRRPPRLPARLSRAIDKLTPLHAMSQMPFPFENAQQRAHCAANGSIRNPRDDLRDGRLAMSVDDIHDLSFALAELRWIRHTNPRRTDDRFTGIG